MTKLDTFESAFKSADKAVYSYDRLVPLCTAASKAASATYRRC